METGSYSSGTELVGILETQASRRNEDRRGKPTGGSVKCPT